MKKTLGFVIAALAVAACGGAQKQDTGMVGNTVAMEDEPVTPEESGGSGTAMALDEANQSDPARDKAIADARAAGIIGGSANPCAGAANPCAGAAASGAPTTWTNDKDTIRGVVRANIGAITFCYEKRLLGAPGLAGKTQAQFTIAPDGTVSAATASGFDADVDACVANVIQTQMKFPAPPGGGSVNVNYPFVFKATP